ncbi:hypothetical protein LZ554_001307 [Drepanopeziza brunnea f. sp. 'monogermtubi']|nr:hypothetical protein LZ554_001307 [Drepanopeziza brunnea f. sp. 'monogermtubi']
MDFPNRERHATSSNTNRITHVPIAIESHPHCIQSRQTPSFLIITKPTQPPSHHLSVTAVKTVKSGGKDTRTTANRVVVAQLPPSRTTFFVPEIITFLPFTFPTQAHELP